MKKTYFAKRNALISHTNAAYIAVGAAIIFFAIVIRLLAPGVVVIAVQPITKLAAVGTQMVTNVEAYLQNPERLLAERNEARTEAAALHAENATLKARVDDLQKLLPVAPMAHDGVAAGIVLRPPQSAYDTLAIDAGTDAGISVNALVEGPGGVLIGRIASATTHTARVVLFSAPTIETEAWVGEGRTPITLTGSGAGSVQASVSKDAPIAVNDVVYVSGSGAIAYGTVVRVDSDPSSPSAVLRIQPFVNPFTMTWVYVRSSSL